MVEPAGAAGADAPAPKFKDGRKPSRTSARKLPGSFPAGWPSLRPEQGRKINRPEVRYSSADVVKTSAIALMPVDILIIVLLRLMPMAGLNALTH